jgi:hypothetical protein
MVGRFTQIPTRVPRFVRQGKQSKKSCQQIFLILPTDFSDFANIFRRDGQHLSGRWPTTFEKMANNFWRDGQHLSERWPISFFVFRCLGVLDFGNRPLSRLTLSRILKRDSSWRDSLQIFSLYGQKIPKRKNLT